MTGYCYYLEDGVEEHNRLEHNLAAHVHFLGSPPRSNNQWIDDVHQSDDLLLPADATAAVNEAAAWAAEAADTELPTASLLAAAPATRAFEADAFERDEHGCMTTALAATPALPVL